MNLSTSMGLFLVTEDKCEKGETGEVKAFQNYYKSKYFPEFHIKKNHMIARKTNITVSIVLLTIIFFFKYEMQYKGLLRS